MVFYYLSVVVFVKFEGNIFSLSFIIFTLFLRILSLNQINPLKRSKARLVEIFTGPFDKLHSQSDSDR